MTRALAYLGLLGALILAALWQFAKDFGRNQFSEEVR